MKKLLLALVAFAFLASAQAKAADDTKPGDMSKTDTGAKKSSKKSKKSKKKKADKADTSTTTTPAK
jgi:Ni/Co efflux regulator RcnB